MGRWMSIDPMEEFWGPYVGMGNRPHMVTDPTGGHTDTWYVNKTDHSQKVWVNDGYDGTVYLNDTDFQTAALFSLILDGSSVAPTNEFADNYSAFFNQHISYDEFSFSNALDYAWNNYGYGGGKLEKPTLGSAGMLGFVGGPQNTYSHYIYRVMSKAEADDVLKFGFRQPLLSSKISTYEGKLFWTNLDDAKWYKEWLNGDDVIMRIEVNNKFIYENGTDVGRRFLYTAPERLNSFNNNIWSLKKMY